MGMFEQTFLLDPPAGKKSVALAASLTAQIFAVAVLIAIPLIFSDHLPEVRLFTPLSLPLTPPPPAPQNVPRATSSSSTRASSGPTKVFLAPRHIVSLSEIPSIDTVEAPPSYSSGVDNGVPGSTGVPSLMSQFLTEPLAKPRPIVADTPKPPAKPTVVGGDVQAAKLLKKVVPVYPPLARQARVSGTVQLIGVIAKDGTIQQLQVASGHPLLVKAALDAVRQWIYRPTLLNGQAVEVIAPIDVIFTLSQ
jgi:periplasmic protein TonB